MTEPDTILGIEVGKKFVIRETELLSGETRLYELHVDGQLVWSGAGDDRVDG